MLHSKPHYPMPKETKGTKPTRRQKMPSTVRIDALKKSGLLLSAEQIADLKKLSLPKGRHHRREINALLEKQGITHWKSPYSIIRGNGMHGEGDALYAIYRDHMEDKPVVIGSGGTSKVKNVQNLVTGEWAVLKVISNFDDTASKEHNILQELGKADSLLIKKDSKDGIHKREIVMERAVGVELYDLLESGKLPTDATLLKKIALNILIKLKEFHDKGFLLRDLKHENIMVDPETGEVALIDVGIAIKAKNGSASDGTRDGTMQYIAPEIFYHNENTEFTIASDTFAAGIVLQGLLTGNLRMYTPEEGLDYTDENGFFMASDGIQRTIKQGHLTIPYIVEKEIQAIYQSFLDSDPKKRMSLDQACKVIEKYIPKEQLTKVTKLTKKDTRKEQPEQSTLAELSQPMGLASKLGVFGSLPINKELEADMHLLDDISFTTSSYS